MGWGWGDGLGGDGGASSSERGGALPLLLCGGSVGACCCERGCVPRSLLVWRASGVQMPCTPLPPIPQPPHAAARVHCRPWLTLQRRAASRTAFGPGAAFVNGRMSVCRPFYRRPAVRVVRSILSRLGKGCCMLCIGMPVHASSLSLHHCAYMHACEAVLCEGLCFVASERPAAVICIVL